DAALGEDGRGERLAVRVPRAGDAEAPGREVRVAGGDADDGAVGRGRRDDVAVVRPALPVVARLGRRREVLEPGEAARVGAATRAHGAVTAVQHHVHALAG